MLVPGNGSGAAVLLGERELPNAAGTADRHALDEPTRAGDLMLLAACQDGEDGAFLCLRCLVSHPIEQKIRGIHRQFGASKGLDLIAMASYGLDDVGQILHYPELCRHTLDAIAPFPAQVVCSYDPGQGAGLAHWARIKIQAHTGLKAYLREHGLLMISPWALLADSSARRVREALQLFGSSALTSERALALHDAYCQAYPAAKAEYRKRSGRQSGWMPDNFFLRSIAPELSPDAAREQLEEICTAVRTLLSGQWQYSQQQGDSEADPFDSAVDWATAFQDEEPWSTADLVEKVNDALLRSIDAPVRAALMKDQPRWQRDRDRRLAWQLYGEGLGQREIAERCGHQQGWVSKLLQEKTLATVIATATAVELRRHPAFSVLGQTVDGAERLVLALRNHLVTPEREGDVAPLRHAVATALANVSA
jgi:hypothetical protein